MTLRIHQTKYQDNIAISNISCNLEREWELVCKDSVYEDSGVCCSQEGGNHGGPSRRYKQYDSLLCQCQINLKWASRLLLTCRTLIMRLVKRFGKERSMTCKSPWPYRCTTIDNVIDDKCYNLNILSECNNSLNHPNHRIK